MTLTSRGSSLYCPLLFCLLSFASFQRTFSQQTGLTGGVTGVVTTASSVCSNPSWAEKVGQNAPGLTQQGTAGQYSETSCQSACVVSPTCECIDWNNLDKTCFFGTVANPPTVANSVVDHWDLTCGASSTCSNPSWTEQVGQGVSGLTMQGTAGQYTETTCQSACVSNTNCYCIDWNNRDKTCFFGNSTQCSVAPVTNSPVDHWVLTCGGSSTCTPTWTEKVGMNAPGLTLQGTAGQYTEASCKTACVASPTCLSCDWNNLDKTCFFGSTQNPATQPNAPVDHWDLTPCGGASACPSPSWTEKVGQNAPGLVLQGTAGQYTETTCKSTCVTDAYCFCVDWNNLDKTCFFENTSGPSTVANSVVDHWDLSCGSSSTCTPTYTKQTGYNAPGLAQQGTAGQYTETTCLNACLALASCMSCDWNSLDKTCFFGTTANPTTTATLR